VILFFPCVTFALISHILFLKRKARASGRASQAKPTQAHSLFLMAKHFSSNNSTSERNGAENHYFNYFCFGRGWKGGGLEKPAIENIF